MALNRKVIATLSGIFVLVLVAEFENCSRVGFNYDYSQAYSSSGAGMTVNNGSPYTNQRIVSIQFTGDTTIFTQMRLSSSEDMDTNPIPWVTFAANTTFDLGAQWASDHTQDGPKTIYAQIRKDDQSPTLALNGAVGLDTVPPNVSGLGILANGLAGQSYSLGQNVPLSFTANDVPAPDGYSSGLASAGMQVGYTQNPDCGSGVTWLSGWAAVQTSVNLPWPISSALSSFYVCALVKDNAGNISSYLSQPLTVIWKVYAGDNNSGDGETYNGPNVRFKLPALLAVDTNGNLFNIDNQFTTIREINSATSVISTIAGNGQVTTPSDGAATNTGLFATDGGRGLAVDLNNNIYFSSSGGVYQLVNNGSGAWTTTNIIANLCSHSPALAFYNPNNVPSLLVSSGCGFTDSSSDNAYLYSIPLSILSTASLPLNQAALSTYVIAGNGKVPSSSYKVPMQKTLTINSSDDADSVGFISAIGVDPQQNIYIATISDPTGAALGNQTVRMLSYQSDGSLLQTYLANVNWINEIAYAPPALGNKNAFLVTSTQNGVRIVSLAKPAQGSFYAVTTPTFIPDGQQIRGVLTIPPQAVGAAPEFYVAVTSGSRIYHLQYDMNTIIEILGRPIYNQTEPIATSAIIGQPEGMAQDPLTGNTYFFDSGNDVVREVVNSGTNPIMLVSGVPGNSVSQDNTGLPLSKALYSGISAFNGGGAYPLTGQFTATGKTKKLFLGEGTTGKVHELDLINNVVDSIAGIYSTYKASAASIFSFRPQSLALASVSSGVELLAFRACPLAACGTTSYQYASFISQIPLPEASQDTESVVAGDLQNYTQDNGSSPSNTSPIDVTFRDTLTMRVDSKNNLFVSAGGFYMIPVSSSTSALQNVININVDGSANFSPNVFEVFENGDDRILVYVNNGGLRTFTVPNVSQITPTNPPKGISSQALCLPGTFFKIVTSMAVTSDQNLLIADASNGRILEYYLRNNSGDLNLQICN
jgi:hypothetical protein